MPSIYIFQKITTQVCHPFAVPSDNSVAIALRLSEKTIALIILVDLPYPSPSEVSRVYGNPTGNSYSFVGTKVSLECLLSLYVLGDFNLPNAYWHLCIVIAPEKMIIYSSFPTGAYYL